MAQSLSEVLYGDGFRARRRQDAAMIGTVVDQRAIVLDALPEAHALSDSGYVVLGKIKYSKDVDAALKGKDKADSAAFFSSAELAAATLLCLVDEESKKSHFLLPSGELIASKLFRAFEFVETAHSYMTTLRFHSTVQFVVRKDLEEAETTSFQTSLKKSIESGLFVVKSDGKPIALSDKPSKTIKTLADLKKQSEPVQVVSFSEPDVINVELIVPSEFPNAPRAAVSAGVLKTIGVDVLWHFPNSQLIAAAVKSFREAVLAQIDQLFSTMANADLDEVQALHFEAPFAIDRSLSVILPFDPKVSNENYNAGRRKELHERFAVASTTPFFTRHNAIKFIAHNRNANGRLLNVHFSLNSAGVGQVTLCSGVYDYYHYMQDKINDDGWGCAYRSLQTIQSWFINQGYTTKPVMTHNEIQKMIYLQGQRDKNFVGSREWIGSIELQSVMKEHMNISSKILHVQSGRQIVEHAWDLIKHFESQGTPVMIGGGQLAYTLLGVDYNAESKRIMFLILDPHYTGKDELKTIQGKGWIGWKDASLFKDNYFYNLMMPQLPVDTPY